MSLRTILLWTHLVTGVAAAVIVFLMSVTGIALTGGKRGQVLLFNNFASPMCKYKT